jgi:hypothetical protein
MTSANPTLPKPPSYYFKPIMAEAEPEKHVSLNVEQQVQNVKNSHEPPELFEPPAKRNLRRPTPFPTTSTPPTPYFQTPMMDRWLLDPMP